MLATAVLPPLKQKWPASHLTFQTAFPEILEGNPYVDKVCEGKGPPSYDSFDEVVELDLTYEYTPHQSILECYAKAAQVAIGSCKMFIRCDPLPFPVSSPYIVMHPGKTQWAGRDWKIENFAQICQQLLDEKLTVFVIGTTSDRGLPHGIDLRGQLTMHEMATLIKHASLFVGIDSFPMHVAQVFDTPGVAFFGSILPSLRIVSQAMTGVSAKSLPCLGCHHRYLVPRWITEECLRGDLACESELSASQFWTEIQKKL